MAKGHAGGHLISKKKVCISTSAPRAVSPVSFARAPSPHSMTLATMGGRGRAISTVFSLFCFVKPLGPFGGQIRNPLGPVRWFLSGPWSPKSLLQLLSEAIWLPHGSRGGGLTITADGAPSLLLSPGCPRQATQATARAATPALFSPDRRSFFSSRN